VQLITRKSDDHARHATHETSEASTNIQHPTHQHQHQHLGQHLSIAVILDDSNILLPPSIAHSLSLYAFIIVLFVPHTHTTTPGRVPSLPALSRPSPYLHPFTPPPIPSSSAFTIPCQTSSRSRSRRTCCLLPTSISLGSLVVSTETNAVRDWVRPKETMGPPGHQLLGVTVDPTLALAHALDWDYKRAPWRGWRI
jgi:hypothetical protein